MKLRNSIKLIMVVAAFAMILSLASCGGSLKLESFTVDLTSIKTTYLVGEEIDFSGIKAVAKYSDESLNKIYTYNELKITYADDITATEGTKEVTVSFEDPNLGVTQQAKVAIQVVTDISVGGDEPIVAVMFEKPSALTQFNSANENAGTKKYGEAGFNGQFYKGGKTYVIGNENEFRFNPQFAVMSDDDVVIEVDSFYSVVEIYVEKNGAYVALAKTAGEGNVVTYADGETLIATVDTYNGKYTFSEAAVGQKVKISVLPSAERYIGEFNPVVLEANVIKAYNVYEAWQLAVIDNNRDAWNEIKAEHGLLGVEVSGIVLHKDIKITAEDVPSSYFYDSEKDVVYTNAIDGTEITIPKGTKFLKEWTEVYRRVSTAPFVIEGNFFTLDTKSFPHIASPAVFGADAKKDYGEDFSNATLFHFSTQDFDFNADPYGVSMNVSVNNLSIMGNAKRDNLVDADGYLASAGGLIFMKSRNSTITTLDNVIGNSYFITYFPDCGKMIVNNSKCFDSYQNAAFVWGYAELEVNNSVFDGCGGPAIIAQSVLEGGAYTLNPKVVTNDSVIMANVTGEEIWFTAVKATSIVGQIKGLGQALQMNGFGNFVGADGKMNVQGALMASGSDAGQIISGIGAQGAIYVEGEGMDRNLTETNIQWATIKTISEYAYAVGGNMPPFLTVYDANGTAYTIWTDGANFYDLQQRALGTDASHQALMGAFMTADTIVLTQGGLSVVLDFYH